MNRNRFRISTILFIAFLFTSASFAGPTGLAEKPSSAIGRVLRMLKKSAVIRLLFVPNDDLGVPKP